MTFEDFDTGGGTAVAEFDPLSGLSFDEPVESAEVTKFSEPPLKGVRELADEMVRRSKSNQEKRAEPLYFDFETIPDFSRIESFALEPLPPEADESELLTAEEFLSQDLKTINEWFEKKTPPAKWIQAIRDAEQAVKKPRKGLFEALDSVAERTENRIKQLSTNPLYCRICSVAWAVGSDKPVSIYAGDDPLIEKHLVEMLWKQIARCPQVIGYGVEFFDVPVLLARSMILGVHPTRALDRRKYGSRDILDLGQMLFNYQIPKGMGLGVVCKSLGIASACPDVDGSQVYELFKAGKVEEIRAYNEDDVMLTQRLHRDKMTGYFCV